jgi:nicotinate dehydrogenase subunit A
MAIALHVNGTSHEVNADPSTPLLYVLRNELHGPKFDCGLGQCGACTVHVDGRATFSCVLPIAARRVCNPPAGLSRRKKTPSG